MIRYIEYDENGEIFHIAEVHTTGDHPSEVAHRESKTRAELQEHVARGKLLHVLAEDDEKPEHGRHKFDHTKKKLVKRTDKQYAAWLKAQEPTQEGGST